MYPIVMKHFDRYTLLLYHVQILLSYFKTSGAYLFDTFLQIPPFFFQARQKHHQNFAAAEKMFLIVSRHFTIGTTSMHLFNILPLSKYIIVY